MKEDAKGKGKGRGGRGAGRERKCSRRNKRSDNEEQQSLRVTKKKSSHQDEARREKSARTPKIIKHPAIPSDPCLMSLGLKMLASPWPCTNNCPLAASSVNHLHCKFFRNISLRQKRRWMDGGKERIERVEPKGRGKRERERKMKKVEEERERDGHNEHCLRSR